MLFMAVETFKNQDAKAIYRRPGGGRQGHRGGGRYAVVGKACSAAASPDRTQSAMPTPR